MVGGFCSAGSLFAARRPVDKAAGYTMPADLVEQVQQAFKLNQD